jgi:hypothetical protein
MQIVLKYSDITSQRKQYLCPLQSTFGYSSVVTMNTAALFDNPVVTGSGRLLPANYQAQYPIPEARTVTRGVRVSNIAQTAWTGNVTCRCVRVNIVTVEKK